LFSTKAWQFGALEAQEDEDQTLPAQSPQKVVSKTIFCDFMDESMSHEPWN